MKKPVNEQEPVKLRFCFAAKGRSVFGLVNGKPGNAFPPRWASSATRPNITFIEDSSGVKDQRRKRAIEI
ncbi:hypothetical protein CF326_g6647 [Tilletia indica]|nr:hypothetical protein CF326_g6647 [Tilletia indica]